MAARACGIHADNMYGPEKCHFSFLRSRPFMLPWFCMQCAIWPGRRNVSFFSPTEQNLGGSSLSYDASPWPHPFLHGMFESTTYPPSSAAVPCWGLGRVAVGAGWLLGQGGCWGRVCATWAKHVCLVPGICDGRS